MSNEMKPMGAGESAVQTDGVTLTAGGTVLTSESNEWDLLAASLPNKDCHIQTTDPLFDSGKGVFWKCTILKPEKCAAKDEKGLAVRVPIRFDQESIDTQGTKRAPGYVFRPRPYVIEGASDSAEDQATADRGRRDLARDLERLGALPRLGSHNKTTVIAAIAKLENRQAEINLYAKDGRERDEETGKFKKFQNFTLRGKAAVGAASSPGNGISSLANV